MAENEPLSDRPKSRWPLILGSLVGGFLMLAVGLGLGWYLFYRPIVNVAVQLPALHCDDAAADIVRPKR